MSKTGFCENMEQEFLFYRNKIEEDLALIIMEPSFRKDFLSRCESARADWGRDFIAHIFGVRLGLGLFSLLEKESSIVGFLSSRRNLKTSTICYKFPLSTLNLVVSGIFSSIVLALFLSVFTAEIRAKFFVGFKILYQKTLYFLAVLWTIYVDCIAFIGS